MIFEDFVNNLYGGLHNFQDNRIHFCFNLIKLHTNLGAKVERVTFSSRLSNPESLLWIATKLFRSMPHVWWHLFP